MIRTQTRSAILLSSTAGTDLYESFSIATWGDSLTQGIPGEREPWQDQLADAGLGFRRIYNGGIGGQDSEEIRDRMLAGTDKHNWSTVIWSGRNDKSNFGSWGQRTLDAIAEMTDALDDAGNTRYLVLGVTNNGVEYPGGPGDANYAEIVALNASLATRYGSRFLDIRAWLVANGLAAVGITPTSGDLTDMSRGVPPTSLRVDATNVHYNTDGNHAIAIALVPLLEAMHSGADYAVAYQALVSGTGAGFAADSLTTNTLYLGQDKAVNGGKFLEAQPVYGNTYAGHLRGISANFDPIVTLDNTIFGYGKISVTPDLYGRGNSIFGSNAGAHITDGSYNAVFGAYAGESMDDASGIAAFGHFALQSLVSGAGHTAIGRYTLNKTTTANPSTAVGFQAGYNNTTGDGTFLGYQAGLGQTTGRFNVAIGNFALASNQTGARLIAIGDDALKLATVGTSIGIGWGAADNLTTGYGTFIGYNIDAPSATAANQLVIGNIIYGTTVDGTGTTVSSGKIGIRNSNPLCTFDVTGSFGLGAPVTKTADFTLAITENDIICNKSGSSCVMTANASVQPGRRIRLQNYSASQTVTSLNTNVVPLGGGASTTAILAAGAGKWADLVSDGTNWLIMAAGG